MKRVIAVAMLIAVMSGVSGAWAALEPAAHPLFEDDAVHQVELTFTQADFWDQLVSNYENFEDIPYIEASLTIGDYHLDSIGVRLKGNSSYFSYSGVKKSFKLDLDEFVSGQEIEGLDKLNLNNCFLDPSFVREKCAYELWSELGVAAGRTNYAAVSINGTFWGLYLLVEQQDQEYIESRWGSGEEGNLWKGEPAGTLEYLGSSEASYWDSYELKTNEEINDWSDLVDFVDILNNTAVADLPDSLHNRLDVDSALAMLALDNYLVNLDSYIGRCANYYFYHRDLDDRLAFSKWDMNESFGTFNMWGYNAYQLRTLSIYWTNPQALGRRPLAERLLQVPAYQAVYEGHMRRLMNGGAEPTTLIARMEELRDLIRPWVYQDTNNMFTTAQFEACMDSDVILSGGPPPGRTVPALSPFITGRHSYVSGVLGDWAPPAGLVLNEAMARNGATIADEAGQFEDWIEITNTGSAAIDLTGFGLTDHLEGVPDFTFDGVVLQPGEYLLLWADEDTGQGTSHLPFKLDGDGEDIYLTDGAVVVDRTTFPVMGEDVSWGRWADGTGNFQYLSAATPGLENRNPEEPEEITLFINEFLAQNDTGLQDETGAYEDWLELHNPGPTAVELGGLFLTDDLTQTTQWALPDTLLPAGGFLVVWCDDDPEDGPLHATFKLSASGEEIGLFGRLAAGNGLIDGHSFGAQSVDISEGRETDGAATWTNFTEPSPGASNGGSSAVPTPSAGLRLLPCHPNPFNPRTTLSFDLPQSGRVCLEIHDARGRRLNRLLDEELPAGPHSVVWDGTDTQGRALPSGIYFSRLVQEGESRTGRMTLLR